MDSRPLATRASRVALIVSTLSLLAVCALSAATLHCNVASVESEFRDTGSPCQTVLREKCGASCTSDETCQAGLYCGADGKCTADCLAGGSCGDLACSPRGRCGFATDPTFGGDGGTLGADASTTDSVCADTDVALTKLIPKVLFLLDQSSSMQIFEFPPGSGKTRWAVLKDVMIGPDVATGGLVKQLQGDAELGLEMYSATDPDPNDGDNTYFTTPADDVCPRFNGKDFDGLSFALDNATAIDGVLRPASVDDDTPTGPALRKVVGLADDGGVADSKGFAALTTTAPRVIVLVTDGEPGRCGDNYSSPEAKAGVVLAAQHAYSQGIRTFVIAIGATTPEAQNHFKAVADAGQGKDPVTGDANAILPSTQDQLVQALRQIVLDARTCTFNLNGQVEAGSEKDGTVMLNGGAVPYDETGAPEEGWRLKNATTLELVGEACKTLKSTPNATLSARFPCGTIKLIPR